MTAVELAAHMKLRGGYYTPSSLANVLAEWALPTGKEHVLEPSCGDGNFLEAAGARLGASGRITAVELFADEASTARRRARGRTEVAVGDAFAWYAKEKKSGTFDAVLGNPPFIRYQNFPEEHRG